MLDAPSDPSPEREALGDSGRAPLAAYALEDRYARTEGRVFLTGTQALVRILLDQARRDRDAGLNTAGFVSGYRGSPLGGVDKELWAAAARLKAARIEFLPAVNEDLAATAVLGSQQVETNPRAEAQGVFGMWYGKGPGVDRAGDALKHGNAYGASPHGGVLVVAGDDHGCVSSSMPHQSDVAFMAWFMPTLAPASVAEYLAFGEWGYALSRFSGLWVGFKAISETVESACSVPLPAPRAFASPDYAPPPEGLHYRWPDLPGPQIEARMEAKKHAALAFAAANPIDRRIFDVPQARYGIVTSGKAHLDAMEALRLLGLDAGACARLGIDVYKVGMVWPLERTGALAFVRGLEEVLVVEEKRGIIESQLKEYFYDWPGDKPARMVGKHDEAGARLIPWIGELGPRMLAPLIARRLDAIFPEEGLLARAEALAAAPVPALHVPGATRTPYFCSGCPHNTSTKVPEGSEALAGIGCHFMASWMDRETSSLIQMGGEGVNWAASSLFTGRGHVFQNLGEGTWYHSGSMAIRQAIAAGANITYKILYNDAVAMTGGQPVDGPVSVEAIAQTCRAEGVDRIALVTDDPARQRGRDFPPGLTIHHRRDLDAVQRELREIPGVTILIYDQPCATETRKRRKRGQVPQPARRVVINELVCEGCGDCSVESNCLSVEPVETEFGRKRRINQSSCNVDLSCLGGFCPSFVTVEGGRRRKAARADLDLAPLLARLPDANAATKAERPVAPEIAASDPSLAAALARLPVPEAPVLSEPWDILVTGVGGTGVVTVGALVTMAAHIEGLGASVLDFTGFAQKFGAVLSYVRLAASPEAIHQVRIDEASADALIGCDVVVSSSPKASACYNPRTRAVLNLAEMPTGDLVRSRDASLRVDARVAAIAGAVDAASLETFDANRIAEALMGDAVFANVLLLGAAWQRGLVPVSLPALEEAVRLNGVAVEANLRALALGRLLGFDPGALGAALAPPPRAAETAAEIIDRRASFLAEYQDSVYAERYRRALAPLVAASEGLPEKEALVAAAARSLFKLMAYKDEWEVARLHAETGFEARIAAEFEGAYFLRYHLAPPLLPMGRDARGRPRKRAFGPWMGRAFSLMARARRLRGTPFDPFGHAAERRQERALIGWYEGVLARCAASLTPQSAAAWAEILAMPMEIRGYGPVKAAAIGPVRARVAEAEAALG